MGPFSRLRNGESLPSWTAIMSDLDRNFVLPDDRHPTGASAIGGAYRYDLQCRGMRQGERPTSIFMPVDTGSNALCDRYYSVVRLLKQYFINQRQMGRGIPGAIAAAAATAMGTAFRYYRQVTRVESSERSKTSGVLPFEGREEGKKTPVSTTMMPVIGACALPEYRQNATARDHRHLVLTLFWNIERLAAQRLLTRLPHAFCVYLWRLGLSAWQILQQIGQNMHPRSDCKRA